MTSATIEQSFYKLKLIKNYRRSIMAQARLTDSSALSIGNERISNLDINTLVEKFAEKNTRRLQKLK